MSASRGRDGETYQDDVDDTPGIERPQPGRGLEQPSPGEDRDQGSAPDGGGEGRDVEREPDVAVMRNEGQRGEGDHSEHRDRHADLDRAEPVVDQQVSGGHSPLLGRLRAGAGLDDEGGMSELPAS